MQSATVSPDIFSTLSRPDRSGAPKYMRLSATGKPATDFPLRKSSRP